MSYQYTPAAERALNAAAACLPRGEHELTPLATLLGLLSEPECRAAKILEAQAIDQAVIRAAWPAAELREVAKLSHAGSGVCGYTAKPLSNELETAFHGAILLLDENPRTCQLATEHLLLGLATSAGEVGNWLRERGVSPDAMIAEICARYGIDHTPIPLAEVDLTGASLELNTICAQNPPFLHDHSEGRDLAAEMPLAGENSARNPNRSVPSETGSAGVRLIRILDAAANRAGEALRVVEDYVRFALDDRALTALCKQLRHDLTAALAPLSMPERLAARDTVHDVGTELSTPAEMTRADLADVAAANVRRLQESLRSLEEFGKVLDVTPAAPSIAAQCEQLRYRAYTLQQQLDAAISKSPPSLSPRPTAGGNPTSQQENTSQRQTLLQRIEAARLYVLIDGRESETAFTALARSLIEAGVDVLQLRDKKLDDRTLLARARLLREATRDTPTLFIMNDRPDLALLADADGVHIGQEELTVAEARRILGPTPLIGVSTHTIEQAREAVTNQADYLGLGPTFPSTTKQFAEFPGLNFLRTAAQEITIPTFAIGGITAENIAEVRAAGIHRVAMSGAILNAAEPSAIAAQVRSDLNR
jgi:thiamine-phosphate pyrophosphorylase